MIPCLSDRSDKLLLLQSAQTYIDEHTHYQCNLTPCGNNVFTVIYIQKTREQYDDGIACGKKKLDWCKIHFTTVMVARMDSFCSQRLEKFVTE